jgi:site-specific DNA recombinase
MSTWELEEITDRQKASVLVRARLGKTINGLAPYGYQWKERKLVIRKRPAGCILFLLRGSWQDVR